MKVFAKGQGTWIKIMSLVIGLTVGLVLVAKVQLENNYNRCIEQSDRVYKVMERIKQIGQEKQEFGCTAGGIVPKMREYISEIETGTRYTYLVEDDKMVMSDKRRISFRYAVLADSCFFHIFSTRILQGNPEEVLSTVDQCMISRRLAEKIGGDPVGQTFRSLNCEMRTGFGTSPELVIRGVFETFDENSTFADFDILVSMPTIGRFMWDGSENLMGNDRYYSFIRLCPNADMENVNNSFEKMQRSFIPYDEIAQWGYEDIGLNIHSLSNAHMQDTQVRNTCTILLVVALVILFTALMNYILVVISSLVNRARQVAVRKCLGAPLSEFYKGTLKESTVHLVLALTIVALILWGAQDMIFDLLGASVTTLFSVQTIWVLIGVCLIVLTCCGLVPGYIYSRIPLEYAYRIFSESKKRWKLSLLAFQFVLTVMLLCLLWIIYDQHDYMLNKDLGYRYDQVSYIHVSMPVDSVQLLEQELRKLPQVESVSSAATLYCEHQSGNEISRANEEQGLFNYSCLFTEESNIVQTMGLTLLEGPGFSQAHGDDHIHEVLVDERFVERYSQRTGEEQIIGQVLRSSQFDHLLTVVGVVKNLSIGSLMSPDLRPMLVMNGTQYTNYVLVKFRKLNNANISDAQKICDSLFPDNDLTVECYADRLATNYISTRRTRNLIAIGCLATLLITLIGLISYIRDEVQRRSRELSIRKVLGSSLWQLQFLFLQNIARIALPSIFVGASLGYYLSQIIMEQFPDQINITAFYFIGPSLVVGGIIFLIICLQTHSVAGNNPVENLKNN